MKAAVIITNYNYGRYLKEAIDSVLAQTRPADQIILVDDGSTDDSRDLLKAYENDARLEIVFGENRGQLVGFERGLERCRADIVYFLDADDRYAPTYIERSLNLFEESDWIDYLFTDVERFGEEAGVMRFGSASRDLGYSGALSRYARFWFGAPTSALAIKKSVLDAFLPTPASFAAEWKTRADDVLVWGASMLAARKYYLAESLVYYRIHKSNFFYGREQTDYRSAYLREERVHRLFTYLRERRGLEADFQYLIPWELKTLQRPTLGEVRAGLKAYRQGNDSFGRKLAESARVWRYYFQSRFSG